MLRATRERLQATPRARRSRAPQRYAGKVVVLTGASSGIGAATATAFAREGARVVLAARSQHDLERVAAQIRAAEGEALVVPTDVTDDDQCQALIDRAAAAFSGIDVLVNNAGVSTRGSVLRSGMAVNRRVMGINFFGSVACTHAALPHLLRSRGTVVVVSSLVGKVAIPGRAPYSASKFAMHGYFEALRCELRARHVHVLMVCPGFVDTNIRFNALGPDGEPTARPGRTIGPMMKPEAVADAILSATHQRRREVVLTPLARTLVCLHGALPRLTDWILSRTSETEPGHP